jgi:hypothetical protein
MRLIAVLHLSSTMVAGDSALTSPTRLPVPMLLDRLKSEC